MIMYLYIQYTYKIKTSSGLRIRTYTYALSSMALVVWYTSIIVKRFQSLLFLSLSLSFFLPNYLCPPYYWQEKKKVDLGLLLIFFFVLFFLFELLDTIRGRSCETNLVKRVKKERKQRERPKHTEKKKIFTLLMHTFIEYIYILRCMWVFGVCTCNIRITFCTF